jgi:hypothetical protein
MFTQLLLQQLPKYSVKRPSTGKNVWFRPILVKEEKKLLTAQELGTKQEIIRAVSEVMDSCYESLQSSKLSTYEFDYLYVQLRIKSVGETINAKFTCPQTQEKIDLYLNLNNIEINGLKDYKPTIKINDIMVLQFKTLTYDDILDIDIDSLGYEELINLTAKCISSITTKDETIEITDSNRNDVVDMLSNMTSVQFGKIIEYFNSIPTYEYDLQYKTSDGVERKIKISGIEDFFTLASVT